MNGDYTATEKALMEKALIAIEANGGTLHYRSTLSDFGWTAYPLAPDARGWHGMWDFRWADEDEGFTRTRSEITALALRANELKTLTYEESN